MNGQVLEDKQQCPCSQDAQEGQGQKRDYELTFPGI